MNWHHAHAGTPGERHTQKAKIERAFLQHPALIGRKNIAQ
jgi:hypothetical protein